MTSLSYWRWQSMKCFEDSCFYTEPCWIRPNDSRSAGSRKVTSKAWTQHSPPPPASQLLPPPSFPPADGT